MVFLLHVGRLTLAISRFVRRNRILCEAAFSPKAKFTELLKTSAIAGINENSERV